MKLKIILNKIICITLVVLTLGSNLGVAFGEEAAAEAPVTPAVGEQSVQPETGVLGETGTNEETGANEQTGNLEVEAGSESSQLNSSDSAAETQVDAGLITGSNDTSYNTGNGLNSSGEVDASVGIVNSNNSNIEGPVASGMVSGQNASGDLDITKLLDLGLVQSASNADTGANSENQAFIDLINKIIFQSADTYSIANNLPINIDTGNNQASYNTGNGIVDTGDVNLSINIWNFVSSFLTGGLTLGLFNIFGDYNGNIVVPEGSGYGTGGFVYVSSAENNNTGADSSNTASSSADNKTTVLNNDQTGIKNRIPIDINTGQNEAVLNTGDGAVNSGDVTLKSNVISIIGAVFNGENWYLVLVNVLGDWAGNVFGGSSSQSVVGEGSGEILVGQGSAIDLSASNDETGADSENTAEVKQENKTDIESSDKTKIENNMPININTGGNKASYNTGGGSITSGDVNLIANFINFVGSNISANNIYLLFVNIFGDWNGSVKKRSGKKMYVLPVPNPIKLEVDLGAGANKVDLESEHPSITSGYNKISNLSGEGGSSKETETNTLSENKEDKEKNNTIVLGGSDDSKNPTTKNIKKGSNRFRDVLKALMILGLLVGLAGLNYQRKLKGSPLVIDKKSKKERG